MPMDAKSGYVLATPRFTAALKAADAHAWLAASPHAAAWACGGHGTRPKGDPTARSTTTGSHAVARHHKPKRARNLPTTAGLAPWPYARKKSTLYSAASSADASASKQPAAPVDSSLLLASLSLSPLPSSSSAFPLAASAVSATPHAASAEAATRGLSAFSWRMKRLKP